MATKHARAKITRVAPVARSAAERAGAVQKKALQRVGLHDRRPAARQMMQLAAIANRRGLPEALNSGTEPTIQRMSYLTTHSPAEAAEANLSPKERARRQAEAAAAAWAEPEEHEEASDHEEEEEEAASSSASSAPPQRRAPVAIPPSGNGPLSAAVAQATGGSQAGTHGNLFVFPLAAQIGGHVCHLSVECTGSSPHLHVAGSHVTNENFPTGDSRRRVPNSAVPADMQLEIQKVWDQLDRAQVEAAAKAEKADAKAKEDKRRQMKAAADAAAGTEAAKALLSMLKAKYKDPASQRALTEAAVRAAAAQGWTAENLPAAIQAAQESSGAQGASAAASSTKSSGSTPDVVQLARINRSPPSHDRREKF